MKLNTAGIWIITFVLLAALGIMSAMAQEGKPAAAGWYFAKYLSNYDGDTVDLHIAIWPGLTQTAKIRVVGLDAPEIRGKCDREKELAVKARDRLRELLAETAILVRVYGLDRWGRYLGTVATPKGDIAGTMIAEGLARKYDGGARLGWCAVS